MDVSDTSITLAQLPYTGFDYGDVYNNLFWIVLVLWSLIIGWIFVWQRRVIANNFASLAKVFITTPHPQEPVILEEYITEPTIQPNLVIGSLSPPSRQGVVTDSKIETEYIKQYVNEEDDDFSSVDFDGVNPDDFWQPREIDTLQEPTKELTKQQKQAEPWVVPKIVKQQQEPKVEPANMSVNRHAVTAEVLADVEQKKTSDSLVLNTTGEYPTLVLTRE